MSPTVYVGRGIGFSIVQLLSTRPNTIVFAGVRTLPSPTDQLSQLAAKLPGVVVPVQITSGGEVDNAAAAELISSKVGKVDVVIANAGVSSGNTPFLEITPEQLQTDFAINTVGPVVLFKALAPLLLAAGGQAKFVVVSSILAQITESLPYAYNAYGASKSAVNYLTKKIDQEFPDIIAFPISPGIVDTDLGRFGAELVGMTTAQLGAISPEQSAAGMLAVVDKATKATHGGKFWNEKGEQLTY